MSASYGSKFFLIFHTSVFLRIHANQPSRPVLSALLQLAIDDPSISNKNTIKSRISWQVLFASLSSAHDHTLSSRCSTAPPSHHSHLRDNVICSRETGHFKTAVSSGADLLTSNHCRFLASRASDSSAEAIGRRRISSFRFRISMGFSEPLKSVPENR